MEKRDRAQQNQELQSRVAALEDLLKEYEQTVIEQADRLETAQKELEQKIAERTQDLQSTLAELKQTQNKLILSEKLSSLGELAAGVAHEINNPLGVILGFSQAVTRRLQPQDPLQLPLKSIEQEALRCKNIVQDLLTFSRTNPLDRQPIDLNEAVEGALSLIQAKARVAQSTVEKELGSNLKRVLANKTQIQQVVINLSLNALDAMEKGGVLIVKTEPQIHQSRSWVCLKVADNGSGIPADVLPHIFEPFYTTKPAGKGTGLGLSLIYEIVKNHSGTIEVESRSGCTEFCVKFPVATP